MEKRTWEYAMSLVGGWVQVMVAAAIAAAVVWWDGISAAQQNLLRAGIILWVADTGLGIIRACASSNHTVPVPSLCSRKEK